jgi:hypothetical protein
MNGGGICLGLLCLYLYRTRCWGRLRGTVGAQFCAQAFDGVMAFFARNMAL